MEISWFNEKPKDCIVTMSSNNLTLNKPATNYFENAYSVMLGLSKENMSVFIKPLNKAKALRHDISENLKYRITVRASYSRVANKAFMQEISEFIKVNFELTARKYKAVWDQKEQLLVVNMKEEL